MKRRTRSSDKLQLDLFDTDTAGETTPEPADDRDRKPLPELNETAAARSNLTDNMKKPSQSPSDAEYRSIAYRIGSGNNVFTVSYVDTNADNSNGSTINSNEVITRALKKWCADEQSI